MGSERTNKLKPLSTRQQLALQLTLDGHTRKQICEQLSINDKTLWNWRQLPAWNEQLEIVLKVDGEDTTAQLKSLVPLSLQTLKNLMASGSEHVRLGAAKTTLEAWSSLVDREEQKQMLNQLEVQVVELQESMQQQQLPGAIDADFTASALDPALSEPRQTEEDQSQPAI